MSRTIFELIGRQRRDDDEGRRSSSPNKDQRNPTSYSPTRTTTFRVLFAFAQQDSAHSYLMWDLCSFSPPSANTRKEPDARTEREETIKSPHQACLLPYPPLLTPVHSGSGSGSRSPFISSGSPFAPASIDRAGLYELRYRHVPLPLSSLPTGFSGPVPSPFVAIPIPLGVGGPGQQHARPLPLPPPHKGQQLLVDPPPLSGAAAVWGKEEGGRCDDGD